MYLLNVLLLILELFFFELMYCVLEFVLVVSIDVVVLFLICFCFLVDLYFELVGFMVIMFVFFLIGLIFFEYCGVFECIVLVVIGLFCDFFVLILNWMIFENKKSK